MFFTSESLRKIAASHYFPDEMVEILPYQSGPESSRADASLEPGGVIKLNFVGPISLVFHAHAWSGSILLRDGSGVRSIDLFSDHPDVVRVNVPGDDQKLSTLAIFCGLGDSNPRARGAQTWLLGVEFSERQPWLPFSQPISETTMLAFGQEGNFMVSALDEVIGASIRNTGVWAPKDIELFRSYIKAGDVVLDIGANIGHHTVFFSKVVGQGGKVIAFEPQAVIYRYACGNLAINDCRNVRIHEICLGENAGHTRMAPISYDAPNNFGALGVGIDQDVSGELVRVQTLDALFDECYSDLPKVDFIKIDVQSFELFVLRGALGVLKKFRPTIFLEISPYWMMQRGYDYKEVYHLLQSIGYQFRHFADGAGIEQGVRVWSESKSEEWDVLCTFAG